ncbi:MAG: hypothetical protein WA137_07390 [Methanothrix sp.]
MRSQRLHRTWPNQRPKMGLDEDLLLKALDLVVIVYLASVPGTELIVVVVDLVVSSATLRAISIL